MISRIFCCALVFALTATTVGKSDDVGPVDGDTYFIAPGAGTESGFQLAGGPYKNSVIDGDGEFIGQDFGGGMILSTDTLIHNGGNNYDLILRVESVGGNILPAGIIGDSDVELTTLGIFVGGGIDSVELQSPVIAERADIEVFNVAGDSIGILDVSGFGNFTTGPGGGWDGSLGFNFGNQIEIGDVGAIELQINFNAIPEPTTFGLLAFSAIAVSIRRQR